MTTTDINSLIVKRLKDKDPTALDYLYDHYSSALYGVIYKTIKHQEMAEETLHDVFLKIWDQIDKFDRSKGTLFTWMFRIARNRAIDVRRSADFKVQDKSDDISTFVDMFETQSNQEDYIGLSGVLNEIGEMCKKLIQLNFFMGYSHAEISESEEMPLGTVKTRLRNCLLSIKEKLKKDFE
ncbi:RNA polymerase sigma factor [Reichenbachiella agarivorans]|uniref:RNA polymerase sigma factor n=1 Tax=Reichenbachiella agarivorans TaxID=2979464 RepID=A0ABY6CMT0_9BACT|nr:RNA polymerase sigma factor [Reichenbachiella agarivorans]UXP31824.1 RNA polymerase sigma factor [Reichenbachiella agarivorans]